MCTVLLPPGDNPIAVNKYIVSFFLTRSVTSLSDASLAVCVSPECKYKRTVIGIGVPTCQVYEVAVLHRTRDVVRGTFLASDTPLPPHVRKRGLVQVEC